MMDRVPRTKQTGERTIVPSVGEMVATLFDGEEVLEFRSYITAEERNALIAAAARTLENGFMLPEGEAATPEEAAIGVPVEP